MLSYLASKTIYIPNETGDISPVDIPAASLETLKDLPPGDYGAMFVKLFLTLIAFVVILFGSLWFLRRLIQQRLQKGSGDQSIQVLEKRMISPKTTLYLVEVENKKVLIAESHLEVKRIESFTLSIPEEETAPE